MKILWSPVYTIQVLHPSLHSRKLGSRKIEFKFVYTRCKKFDEYTQVLAGDTTNKMAFLGGEEGAALCIALLCTIVLRRRLSSKKRSTMGCISMKSIRSPIISLIHVTTGARGKDHPPFSNFLFTNLFSIKFLYFCYKCTRSEQG
jgi:hypothetical protein